MSEQPRGSIGPTSGWGNRARRPRIRRGPPSMCGGLRPQPLLRHAPPEPTAATTCKRRSPASRPSATCARAPPPRPTPRQRPPSPLGVRVPARVGPLPLRGRAETPHLADLSTLPGRGPLPGTGEQGKMRSGARSLPCRIGFPYGAPRPLDLDKERQPFSNMILDHAMWSGCMRAELAEILRSLHRDGVRLAIYIYVYIYSYIYAFVHVCVPRFRSGRCQPRLKLMFAHGGLREYRS